MSPNRFSEDELVERPAVELLATLGWETANAYEETFGEGATLGRDGRREVVLQHRLRTALARLNPELPVAALEEALAAVSRERSLMNPTRANHEVYELLRDGFLASWQEDGEEQTARVAFVDWREPARNEWLAANQVWVAGELYVRRVDLVLFVNGIPLVLAEFKGAQRRVEAAYDDNLSDYRGAIPQLFVPLGLVILSNGSDARVGAPLAPWGQFGAWQRIDAAGTRGRVELETAIRGTCEPARLLDFVESFVAYSEQPGGLVKSVARYHQVLGGRGARADSRDG